jgi:hypothetical protein
MDTSTNYEWVVDAIASAMTIERLKLLACEIAIDKGANVDYTTDPVQLETIRQLLRDRFKHIREAKQAHVKQS